MFRNKVLGILFSVLLTNMSYAATYYYSILDGSWTDLLNWSNSSGGPTCSCSPNYNTTSANDFIYIETNITLTGTLDVSANTTIVIRTGDTLTVNGDAIFDNGSDITVEAGGVLIINGNVTNNNNSNTITIDGEIIVDGNFSGGNGSQINGSGEMDITGTVTTTGTGEVFGSTVDCTTPGECSSSASSPLPIELLKFSAIPSGDEVQLAWTTVSEMNNDYFIVERSDDTYQWEALFTVNGAGTSTEMIDYFEVDTRPLSGVSYYRLIQVDYDGKQTIHHAVPIKLAYVKGEIMGVIPNPVPHGETLRLSFQNLEEAGLMNKEILVVLRDISGKELYSKIELIQSDNAIVAVDKTQTLTTGVYLVIASADDRLYSKRIVIE